MLQTMDDSELIRRYRLDRAGIMFVTDLIRDTLTSRLAPDAIAPEMKVIATLSYLATGKSDDLGLSQPSVSRAITQTITALYTMVCLNTRF